MRSRPSSRKVALRRLSWPIGLTRLSLALERFWRAFWPLITLLFASYAAFGFGMLGILGRSWLLGLLALLALGLGWLLYRGARAFRWPARVEASDRLDETLPGRPIAALIDAPVTPPEDAASAAVWSAHQRRMAQCSADARPLRPDLDISDRDPFGLRIIAATALILALFFGPGGDVADVTETLTSTPPAATTPGPSWEGWVEPPLYTGLPSLYLGEIHQPEFEAPAGSRIVLRFYGEAQQVELSQSLQEAPLDTPGPTMQIAMEQSGHLSIGDRDWQITLLPDARPVVEISEPVEGVPPGGVQITYHAMDDYGVAGGEAVIALNPDAADRRFGLALDPEAREPLTLTLPLPFSSDRSDYSEVLVEDLSEHPFANLPVTLTLSVRDDAGQIGSTVVELERLPGRRFFNPLAGAIAEMRRDLLWSRQNAPRVAQILRAISHRPENVFDDESAFLLVRTAIRRLESGIDGISAETRDEIAAILWEAALEIEDIDLSDALARLQRAQDRLEEAMRQGASEAEIAELMEELREAMDDYMQQLANESQPEGTDEPDSDQETMELSQNDFDEMLRRIEELMQQGRMAEAQEMLDALREMMENLQITQGEGDPNGPRTPGQQAMENLQEMLRDQQGLADESFRELQEQFGRPGQGQPPQPGQQQGEGQGGDETGESLAERQQGLREELMEQAEDLPGRGSPDREEALRRLEEANRAMRDAERELENGDLAEALDSQSEAMEALREGMQELGRALAQEDGEEPGQGEADGNMRAERPLEDPLGRQSGNSGSFESDQDFAAREEAYRRARELMSEIRRRAGEQQRPELELDYLRRLLQRFPGAAEE